MFFMSISRLIQQQGRKTMKKKILMWILNILLKQILENANVQQKQKDVIWLMNTIVDALRDFKLEESELRNIKDAIGRLFS